MAEKTTGNTETVRLRFDVAYDGSALHGWAKQPGLRTVQGELENALQQVIRSDELLQLTVAGRTDAGVHARGQVAHVDVTTEHLKRWLRGDYVEEHLDGDTMARRLNGLLHRAGEDIRVQRIAKVSAAFDARFSALWRRYSYRVADATALKDPLTRRFTTEIDSELDLNLLNSSSKSLLGLHDFSAFCKAREGSTAIRTLQRFEWTRDDDGVLTAAIQADAFCHSMVRALVGAVTAVASGRLQQAQLLQILDARERTSHFAVMPPHGLCLDEIHYPADSELAQRADQTRARRVVLDS